MVEKNVLDTAIKNRLHAFVDPYLGRTLAETKSVKNIVIVNQQVRVELSLGYPVAPVVDKLRQALTAYLTELFPDTEFQFQFQSQIQTHNNNRQVQALPNIKNIIAIASGKGGVGKSLVTNQLVRALQQAGANVGLLDADIYGPSQPAMLGTKQAKPKVEDNQFIPVESAGVQTMSMGYLVEHQTAMIWRGPMIAKAMQQMLEQTKWQALDYLLIDMPPGTGDVQLTLCQKMPVSGAVIVTTPQELALLDVRRACEMFIKMGVPLLGVIENMSGYTCKHCGETEHLFNSGGGERIASEYNIPLLGNIPLAKQLQESTDNAQSTNPYAELFMEIAIKTTANLALQPQDFSHKFPKIVVK